MANRISVLNWLQRGSVTYINIARMLNGQEINTIDQLADRYGLSILDSERFNQALIRDDVLVIQSGMPYDADLVLAAAQEYHPDLAGLVSVDPGSLGSTSTTTTTTTTSTTTTTTSTSTTTTTTTTSTTTTS